ncbi:MAG: chitobiase/beta-hexosaminidase C-terminal domain-containing protein, partial [Verrucomicrobia bacterium]|nr:chitobiase/beta-hexosaminidase C-terminal domain-containing protein [Verrucomicrobiota bacterium]
MTSGAGTITSTPAATNYLPGTSVTFIATPARYYAFSQWSDGDTNNPRTVTVGTNSVYTAVFTNLVPLETHILREWDQSYGGPAFNYLTAIAPSPDGGYLLGGPSNSGAGQSKTTSNFGDFDFWAVKVDADGNQSWDTDFGGSAADNLNAILPTPDGGYLLGGSSASGVSGNKTTPNYGKADFWVVKIDGSGRKQWERDFGGSGDDELTVMASTTDGGYILGGATQSDASGNKTTPALSSGDFWVVKIDAQGNKEWESAFPSGGRNQLNALLPTADGDYLLGGAAAGAGLDYWLLHMNPTGNKLWQQTYGGNADDILHSIAATRDGGYLLGGESWSVVSGDKTAPNYGVNDFWLVKVAADGSKLWDRSYGAATYDALDVIQPWPDGRYVLCGNVSSNSSAMRVMEVDDQGNLLAGATFGGPGNNNLTTATRTADGALLLGGASMAPASSEKLAPLRGVQDFWLVKAAVVQMPVGTPVVTIDHLFDPQGNYTASGSALVTMTTSLAGGRLYYTVDGSGPGTNSPAYSGPFTLNHSAIIRALTVGANGLPMVVADPVNLAVTLTAPQVVSVAGLAANQTIGVTFDELLSSSATNVADYRLGNGSTVTNAVLQDDGRSVQLFVSGGLANDVTLTINQVEDSAGHPIAANTTVAVPLIALASADVGPSAITSQAFAAGPGAVSVLAGGEGMGGTNDGFNFLYAPQTGDFDVAVQITNFVAAGPNTLAGLMARETLAADSRELSAVATLPSAGAVWLTLYRALVGGPTTNWPGAFTPQGLPYPNVWVRLQRVGDTFTAYAGTNGLNWAAFGQVTPNPPYPDTVWVGLATTAATVSGISAHVWYEHFGAVTNVGPPSVDDSWDTLHFAI